MRRSLNGSGGRDATEAGASRTDVGEAGPAGRNDGEAGASRTDVGEAGPSGTGRAASARRIAPWVAAAVAIGCVSDAQPGSDAEAAGALAARGRAEVGGDVVSTVDGHPIRVEEVAAAARRAGVDPPTALSRLQDEMLLAAHAASAGYGGAEAERAARRAMVQALLEREVESRVGPGVLSEEELAQAFEENLERFERPERRGAAHVVAGAAEGAPEAAEAAARRWIEERIERLREVDDPAAALLSLRRRTPRDHPFEITVEEVPPLSRRDRADPAYLSALFEQPGPGLIEEPVRTAFGWHAIVVQDIEPAWEASPEEALATLRAEMLAARRSELLQGFLRQIGQRQGVRVERAARERLAAIELTDDRPGGGGDR